MGPFSRLRAPKMEKSLTCALLPSLCKYQNAVVKNHRRIMTDYHSNKNKNPISRHSPLRAGNHLWDPLFCRRTAADRQRSRLRWRKGRAGQPPAHEDLKRSKVHHRRFLKIVSKITHKGLFATGCSI